MKITFEKNGEWWDWTVEGDENSRGSYCGTATCLHVAYTGMAEHMKHLNRHPYNPKVRTEY